MASASTIVKKKHLPVWQQEVRQLQTKKLGTIEDHTLLKIRRPKNTILPSSHHAFRESPVGTAQRPGSIIACPLENVSLYWRHPTVSMVEGWVGKNVWKYVLYACAVWMEPGRVHNTKTPYILATCSFSCGKTCISAATNKASDIWATMSPSSCNSPSIHSCCCRPALN